MKRKGKSKDSSRSWPLDDWIKKASESIGRFREAARERMKEDMGGMILRTVPYFLVFYFVEKGS